MIEYTVRIHDNGLKEWLLNDKLHREDGPAIEYPNGLKCWYFNDERHRKDGPAIEYPDGTKHWYLNGNLHRKDGPAVECSDGVKLWFLNGVNLTETEFNTLTKAKELTINEIEQLLGYKIKVVK